MTIRENVAHTEKDEATGVTLKIIQDEDSGHLDPTESDGAIIITVLHSRYTNPGKDAGDRSCVPDLKTYDEDGTENGTKTPDFNDREDLQEFVRQHCNNTKSKWAAFPLFMYDHSGVRYSIKPFGCKWDSGQVGFVFVRRSEVTDAQQAAEASIKVYDDWANGNVWGYVVEDSEGETMDSCWGYIGDWDAEYLMSEAKKAFVSEVAQEKKRIAAAAKQEKKRIAAAAKANKQRAKDIETVRSYLIIRFSAGEVVRAFNRLFPE